MKPVPVELVALDKLETANKPASVLFLFLLILPPVEADDFGGSTRFTTELVFFFFCFFLGLTLLVSVNGGLLVTWIN